MTRTTPRTHRRPRRISVAAAGVATTVASLAGATTVSAGSQTSSVKIARQAELAVDAYERWQATGRLGDYLAFTKARTTTAGLTAAVMGVPPERLRADWARTSLDRQHALLAAISQLGVPYRSMASKEGEAFDCSGLMLFAFAEAGVDLPRSSRDQFRAADEVDQSDALPGDLVYYPGHVSMYIGEGLIVHSPNSGHDVEVRPLFDRSVRFAEVFPAGRGALAGAEG